MKIFCIALSAFVIFVMNGVQAKTKQNIEEKLHFQSNMSTTDISPDGNVYQIHRHKNVEYHHKQTIAAFTLIRIFEVSIYSFLHCTEQIAEAIIQGIKIVRSDLKTHQTYAKQNKTRDPLLFSKKPPTTE